MHICKGTYGEKKRCSAALDEATSILTISLRKKFNSATLRKSCFGSMMRSLAAYCINYAKVEIHDILEINRLN